MEPDLSILALFKHELVAAPEVRPEGAVPRESGGAAALHGRRRLVKVAQVQRVAAEAGERGVVVEGEGGLLGGDSSLFVCPDGQYAQSLILM